MTPTLRPPRCPRPRAFAAALALLAVSAPGIPVAPVAAAEEGRLVEVGRVPLLGAPEIVGGDEVARSGWLVLDPATRRGYQLLEARFAAPGRPGITTSTIVQSFDLDTLKPRRRAVLAGAPVTTGTADAKGVSSTEFAGEVVHAVDPVARRIYLALAQPARLAEAPGMLLASSRNPPDGRRPLVRLVAIDEDEFERCGGVPGCPFASSFREPETQAHLHPYWVAGMTVSRRHVPAGAPGRLVVLFAQPQFGELDNVTPLFDHTLVQWDPAGLAFAAGDALLTDGETGGDTAAQGTEHVHAVGPPRRVEVCSGATLASAGPSAAGHGNYQWGLLVTRDAVWTACTGDGEGRVARVGLDPATGAFRPVGGQEGFRLSQAISDVLVDPGGGRLLVRSFGNGHTWWVFDTTARRFTGAVAAKSSDFYSLAAGLDPTTGRLWQLTPDYAAAGVPVRGGLAFSDTRLDPAPPLENVDPAMAHPAAFAIRVDPVARRVYVRRAHPSGSHRVTVVYPGTQSTTPAPPEPFYRVLEDRIPVTQRPAEADDSVFTTDVAEAPGLTRASYLGSGSGYGTRALLVGGLNAAASPGSFGSCGRDDREVVAGSVRGVEVSDLAAAADAAGLDADGRTRDDLGSPARRCVDASAPHTDEASFGPDGRNDYRATCTGDDGARKATAPTGGKVPRDRFASEVSCEHAHGSAEASSTGALSVPALDGAQAGARDDTLDDGARAAAPPALRSALPAETLPSAARGQVPEERLEVGYSRSEVTVTREAGRGVTVRVEAIARNIVVPGVGTIGAVRATATATATGRRGGAGATYSRVVCGVRFPTVAVPGCLDEAEQGDLERAMNEDLQGRGGRVRFRPPDPALLAGSASGYRAGVQRPAADGFEDTRIARDVSLALPGMELVLYRGDSSAGTGRQFFHFAGVQAGVSYGIACLYGQRPDGRCARAGDDPFETGPTTVVSPGPDGTETITVVEPGGTVLVPSAGGSTGGRSRSTLVRRILEAPVRLVQDALRLLFANPREFGLMAAVWALLWAPCWLGERRRSLGALRARRAVIGGVR